MASILIYEEDDLMRELLEEWLRDSGHRVIGSRRCPASPEDTPSLVIVSVSMPKDGGAQQIREVQKVYPGVPIIALSAQFRAGLSAVGPTAEALGVQYVIAKPLTRADLLGAVRTMTAPPA